MGAPQFTPGPLHSTQRDYLRRAREGGHDLVNTFEIKVGEAQLVNGLIKRGLFEERDNQLHLTDAGRRTADAIVALRDDPTGRVNPFDCLAKARGEA